MMTHPRGLNTVNRKIGILAHLHPTDLHLPAGAAVVQASYSEKGGSGDPSLVRTTAGCMGTDVNFKTLE